MAPPCSGLKRLASAHHLRFQTHLLGELLSRQKTEKPTGIQDMTSSTALIGIKICLVTRQSRTTGEQACSHYAWGEIPGHEAQTEDHAHARDFPRLFNETGGDVGPELESGESAFELYPLTAIQTRIEQERKRLRSYLSIATIGSHN